MRDALDDAVEARDAQIRVWAFMPTCSENSRMKFLGAHLGAPCGGGDAGARPFEALERSATADAARRRARQRDEACEQNVEPGVR